MVTLIIGSQILKAFYAVFQWQKCYGEASMSIYLLFIYIYIILTAQFLKMINKRKIFIDVHVL